MQSALDCAAQTCTKSGPITVHLDVLYAALPLYNSVTLTVSPLLSHAGVQSDQSTHLPTEAAQRRVGRWQSKQWQTDK